eukprot:scaffold81291_cov51-Phaeocystis_antarctica.AAC.3
MPGEYPTNDVVVAESPALRSWLNEKLRSYATEGSNSRLADPRQACSSHVLASPCTGASGRCWPCSSA